MSRIGKKPVELPSGVTASVSGQTVEVTLPLKHEDLLFLGRDLRPTVEPGLFDVWLAPDAQSGEPAQFTLT